MTLNCPTQNSRRHQQPFEITLTRISQATNTAAEGMSAYSVWRNVAVVPASRHWTVPARQSGTSISATLTAGCNKLLHRLQAVRLIQWVTNILFNFDYSRPGFNLGRTMNRDATTTGMRNIRADNGNQANPNFSFHSFCHCLAYQLDWGEI